ncbi:hypothetical protein AB4Z54_08130, partial [Streptomyces sp. MCAF7]
DPSGPRPVVLHSPGVGEAYAPSPLAEELASHGYVVVTILHDEDEGARAADVRFVLDQLISLAPGVLDLSRIGLVGRSALHDDPRITAVADLDGILAAASADDPRTPLVAFFDRRLRGGEETAVAATAARAGR